MPRSTQVAGFYIESMLDEDVNAAKGSFKIEDAAVQVANGAWPTMLPCAQRCCLVLLAVSYLDDACQAAAGSHLQHSAEPPNTAASLTLLQASCARCSRCRSPTRP